MDRLTDPATRYMRAAISFHRDDAGRKRPEKLKDLIQSNFLAQHRPAQDICPTLLKHILRQVEPDRDKLQNARFPLWVIADPPWHINAVGGRSHHQTQSHTEYLFGC